MKKYTENIEKLHEDSINHDLINAAKGETVFIIIDTSFGENPILGVYSNMNKALKSKVWAEFGETPNNKGEGNSLFVREEAIQ
jgi:hypothetical protein